MKKILILIALFMLCMSAVPVLAEDSAYRTINGTLWHDMNGDHLPEPGEPVMSGWKIHFFMEGFHGSYSFAREVVTGADGSYANTMVLPVTNYLVCEVMEPDYVQTFPEVVLPATGYGDCAQFGSGYGPIGYNITIKYAAYDGGNDFGNRKVLPRISGRVFHDANANGVNDGDDGAPSWMISGWTVYADYNNNFFWDWPQEPYANSDDQGLYTIFGVEPGSWTVREIPKYNMHCSFPATSDAGGCYHTVSVPPGGILGGIDFGNWAGAALNGIVVNDLNANHQIDPGELDQGIPGWRVYADLNGNGFSDTGEPYTYSGNSGVFYLTDLKPGSFSLRVTSAEFWECSYPAGCAYDLALSSGQTVVNNNFAFHRPEITVCGSIYQDPDGDGVMEPGPGMGGIRVDLWSTKTACVQYNAENPAECLLTAPVKDTIIASTVTEPGSGRYCLYKKAIQGTRYLLAQNATLLSTLGWTQTYPKDTDPYLRPGYPLFLTNPLGTSEGWYFLDHRAVPLPEVIPLPGFSHIPTDPDSDGIFEDLNGNYRLDFADVVLYFNQMTWIAANEPVCAFDLNGNGRIDFADIVALFNEI